ncbi:EamA domain-containing membrane protein RarD [Humitalea rosea]|uniref:EamA domain-containing membrane protein RarD n=1 Tax=Humitalea rosea TaxID=990373 RepID=A0A2W7IML1_9PROT|nr:DMT family transporter [Humitalea rosea]PZW39853.1 EamA domain-containing membrane protein RarD [Humitalea rosea]
MAATLAPRRHDPRRGALLMLCACALFILMGATIKGLAGRVHWAEIMFFRCAVSVPLVVLLAASRGQVNFATRRIGGHIGRAFSGTLAMTCSFFSLTVLPLAEQTALTYSTPLFVTLLAIPFLGERPGAARWTAVLVGFCGILVIALGQGAFLVSGPRDVLYLLGFGAAVTHGLFSAITTMLVRSLSATEKSTTIVLWQSLLMSLLIALALPFVWVTPGLGDLALLVCIGLLGGVAQLLLTEAWASAQVSAVAPFSYTALLWAALFGWIAWGEMPGVWTWAGAGLIVLAGLAMLRSELAGRRNAT